MRFALKNVNFGFFEPKNVCKIKIYLHQALDPKFWKFDKIRFLLILGQNFFFKCGQHGHFIEQHGHQDEQDGHHVEQHGHQDEH